MAEHAARKVLDFIEVLEQSYAATLSSAMDRRTQLSVKKILSAWTAYGFIRGANPSTTGMSSTTTSEAPDP